MVGSGQRPKGAERAVLLRPHVLKKMLVLLRPNASRSEGDANCIRNRSMVPDMTSGSPSCEQQQYTANTKLHEHTRRTVKEEL